MTKKIVLIILIIIPFFLIILNFFLERNLNSTKNTQESKSTYLLPSSSIIRKQKKEKINLENQQDLNEINQIVKNFQEFIKNRNVDGIISLYTPPRTDEEIKSYNSLIGKDPDIEIPRLFNNTTSNFIIEKWEIKKIQKNDNEYFVLIEEVRKKWCNADPCAGTYSFEEENFSVLKIIKFNSNWMIEKYYFKNPEDDLSSQKEGSKYEALYF